MNHLRPKPRHIKQAILSTSKKNITFTCSYVTNNKENQYNKTLFCSNIDFTYKTIKDHTHTHKKKQKNNQKTYKKVITVWDWGRRKLGQIVFRVNKI